MESIEVSPQLLSCDGAHYLFHTRGYPGVERLGGPENRAPRRTITAVVICISILRASLHTYSSARPGGPTTYSCVAASSARATEVLIP